jgi:single-strand DNA-binding protein
MLMKINGLVRFVRDSEMINANGTPVLKGTIASSEKFKDNESQLYQDFVSFSKQAEILNRYSGKKGDQIYLTGKLKTEKWQDKNGENRSKNVMIIEGFDFVSSGNAPQQRSEAPKKQATQSQFDNNFDDDDIPF